MAKLATIVYYRFLKKRLIVVQFLDALEEYVINVSPQQITGKSNNNICVINLLYYQYILLCTYILVDVCCILCFVFYSCEAVIECKSETRA